MYDRPNIGVFGGASPNLVACSGTASWHYVSLPSVRAHVELGKSMLVLSGSVFFLAIECQQTQETLMVKRRLLFNKKNRKRTQNKPDLFRKSLALGWTTTIQCKVFALEAREDSKQEVVGVRGVFSWGHFWAVPFKRAILMDIRDTLSIMDRINHHKHIKYQ